MSEDAKKYRTALEFTTDDKAFEAGASKIENRLEKLAEKSKETLGAFAKGIGSSILGGVGLGIGQKLVSGLGEGMADLVKESFNANRELGAMRKGIAGTLVAFQSWKPGIDMVDRAKASMRDAKYITDDLEEAESRLAIPLEELSASYRYLGSTAIQQYGKSQKQATDFTIDAAAAAKALGSDIGGVSMGITRLLETRNLKGVDPVTTFLRSVLGKTKELKTMAPEKLFDLVGEKLHSLTPAAEEMSKGMGGAIFRIKDFFEDTLRDVGGPAFDFISKKVVDWQHKFEDATGGGKKLVDVLGGGVLKAVEMIADGIEIAADGISGVATFVDDLHMDEVFTDLKNIVKDFWDIFGDGGDNAKDIMDIIRGGADALFVVFSAGKILVHETLKFVDQVFGAIVGGINKVLGLIGKSPMSAETTKMLKELNPLNPMNTFGAPLKALKMLGQVQSKDVGDGSMFGEWGKLYADRLKKREARNSPVYGPPVPGHTIPDTDELTRRGHPVNNFYGDIKVNQQFKEADPDNVWIQLKDALEGAAERTMVGRGHHAFGPGVG
jgi:hypothetical protein